MTESAATVSEPAPRGRRPMSERRRGLQRLEISREAVRLFRAQGLAATTTPASTVMRLAFGERGARWFLVGIGGVIAAIVIILLLIWLL